MADTTPYFDPGQPTGDLPFHLQSSVGAEVRSVVPQPVPDAIGPYRIIREVGRGGMGLVYLGATEGEQFSRRVAVKLLKKGMDTEDVLRRFEFERQVLGALTHPGIARLYDAGETADGRPYLVMEFIEGMRIDKYCDVHRLKIEERLRLFCKVCSAVHYAHQNLVIHRDIKPSNIQVTKDGAPKLLDFGIAKLVNPEMSLMKGDMTAPDVRVMTPEYASPEQVRGDPITTATDVYSLGVLLYELMSGHRPYHLGSRVQAEMNRVICDVEPEKPSTAISRAEDVPDPAASVPETVTPESVSKTRESRPEQLRRRLAGDVDNIVLMAMRKETRRRYASAEQLAEDINRHLTGLPVIARADTVGYRFGKFVKRNRAAVAAGIAIALLLFGGIIATTLAWRTADLAQVAEREQRARADRRFAQVRELANTFLFDFHDSIRALDGSLPARELIVAKGLQYLDALTEDAADDAVLQRDLARAYERIGEIRGGARGATLGDTKGAMESFRTAQAMQQKLLDASPDDLELVRDLSTSHLKVGDLLNRTGDIRGALQAYGDAVKLRERLVEADRLNVPARRGLDIGLTALAKLLTQSGDTKRGAEIYRRSLALRKDLARENPDDLKLQRDLTVAYIRTGSVLCQAGEHEQGIAEYEEALRIRKRLFRLAPHNTTFQRDLGVIHLILGGARLELDEIEIARAGFERSLEIAAEMERDNPTDARSKYTLALAHEGMGQLGVAAADWSLASRHFNEFRVLIERLAREDRTDRNRSTLARAYEQLGGVVAAEGDHSAAIDYGEQAIAILRPLTSADDHAGQHALGRTNLKLGSWFARARQPAPARECLEEARDIYEMLLDSDPSDATIKAEHRETLDKLSELAGASG